MDAYQIFKKILIGSVAVTASTSAFSEWSGYGNVSTVYSHNGTNFIESDITSSPCGTAGKFWWPIDDADAKDMLSISLAALMGEKKVRLVFDGNSPQCLHGGGIIGDRPRFYVRFETCL